MADTAKLTATLVYTPSATGVSALSYTTPQASVATSTSYQFVQVDPLSGTYVVTPAFPTAITSFLYMNTDTVNTVTITISPLGQSAGATNTFVVAAGGWVGGTISLNKTATITVTGTNASGSPGLLYIAGN